MRRQDELILLFPRQDRLTGKLLLSETDQHARAFDGEDLLDLLVAQLASQDPVLKHQAFFSLSLFLPDLIRRRYDLSPEAAGLWTGFVGGEQLQELLPAQEKVRQRARRDQVFTLLAPLARALIDEVPNLEGRDRSLGLLALSRFPISPVHRAFQRWHEADPTDVQVSMGRTRSHGRDAADVVADALFGVDLSGNPDLLLDVSRMAPDQAGPFLSRLATRTSREGRINLALGMSRVDPRPDLDSLQPLLAPGDGGVDVFVLRALVASNDLSALASIQEIHRRNPHPFVRSQAVRAAGHLGGERARSFCLENVASEDPLIQAQALESLVRLRAPLELIRDQVQRLGLTESPHLRTRVNALLASVRPEGDDFGPGFRALVLSQDPLPRLEAAYILGYWQNRVALGYLATLAARDPHPLVRVQAIKSLSRYPAGYAFGVLGRTLGSRQEAVARSASRVMTRYRESQARQLFEPLSRLAGAEDRPSSRALALSTLGHLAGREGLTEAASVLTAGLDSSDPIVISGSLMGWCRFGPVPDEAVRTRMRTLAGSPDPGMASRAALALFLQGGLDAVGILGNQLTRRPVTPVLAAILEIALLADTVIPADRFFGLNEAIESSVGDEEDIEDIEVSRVWGADVVASPTPAEETEGDLFPEDPRVRQRLAEGQEDPPVLDTVGEVAAARKSVRVRVDPLRALLQEIEDGPSAQQRIEDEIARDSYLVGDSEFARLLEEGPLTWVPAPIRAGLAYLARNRILMVPILALGVIFVILIASPRESLHPLPASTPTVLSAMFVEGTARSSPAPGAPESSRTISTGGRIRLGERLDLEPGTRSVLITATGTRFRVKGPARLTVDKMTANSEHLHIHAWLMASATTPPSPESNAPAGPGAGGVGGVGGAGGPGKLAIRARPEDRLYIRLGDDEDWIGGEGFWARLTGLGDAVEVRVERGQIGLKHGEGPVETLGVGAPRAIPVTHDDAGGATGRGRS